MTSYVYENTAIAELKELPIDRKIIVLTKAGREYDGYITESAPDVVTLTTRFSGAWRFIHVPVANIEAWIDLRDEDGDPVMRG